MPNYLFWQTKVLFETTPPAYRVYILAENGTIDNVVRLAANDDDHAIEYAKSMVDGHAIDLWDGLRFIDQFPPNT